MIDPISDMLTRIRNAQAVGHTTVSIPFSKAKFSLAEIFLKEKIIKNLNKKGRGIKRLIELELLYEDERRNTPRITEIKRISSQGRRQYTRAKDLRPILDGYGFNVISTSEGLMTGKEARKKALGGEILCEIS